MHVSRFPRSLFLSLPVLLLALGAAAVLLTLRDGSSPAPVRIGGEATLVFAEFGPSEDRVYAAPAANPAERTLVATVPHVGGWGINPAPSMVGSLVVYTVLPPEAEPRRDAPAELWLLDVSTGASVRLASDADLLAQPRFDATGSQVAYRATTPTGEQELVRVDLDTRLRRVLHTSAGGFGVFPIGFTNDSALIFAALSISGTDIYRVRDREAPEFLVHASDNIARDWTISPDGRELSYLAPELHRERYVHRLHVVSTEDGRPLDENRTAVASNEQFSPVWTPDGDAITVGQEAYPDSSAPAMTLSQTGETEALTPPAAGFDVPLAWSPDGRYLVARSFDGVSAHEPGRESIVVISKEGQRLPVEGRSEVIVIGWVGDG